MELEKSVLYLKTTNTYFKKHCTGLRELSVAEFYFGLPVCLKSRSKEFSSCQRSLMRILIQIWPFQPDQTSAWCSQSPRSHVNFRWNKLKADVKSGQERGKLFLVGVGMGRMGGIGGKLYQLHLEAFSKCTHPFVSPSNPRLCYEARQPKPDSPTRRHPQRRSIAITSYSYCWW